MSAVLYVYPLTNYKLQNIVFALGVKGLKYEGFFSCKRDLNIELQC